MHFSWLRHQKGGVGGGGRGGGGLRYIYVVRVLLHLQSSPLGRVEHQEALQEVLAVRGHVEGDAVLPPQDALTQLLQEEEAFLLNIYMTFFLLNIYIFNIFIYLLKKYFLYIYF